jgi:hypothetical protein
MSHTLIHRLRVLFLSLIGGAAVYACADGVGPQSRHDTLPDLQVNGEVSGSVWRVANGQLTYVTSATGYLDGRLTPDGFRAQLGAARPLSLSPLEIEAVRMRLRAGTLGVNGDVPSRAPNPAGRAAIRRISFKTHAVKVPERNGLRTEFVPHPLGDGRPPLALLVYAHNRPVALVEYGYKREGRTWRVAQSRGSLFDSTGAATRLGALILPAALHAATTDDAAVRCVAELAAYLSAGLALAAAVMQLDLLMTRCATGDAPACAQVQAATFRVAAAFIAMAVALERYAECVVKKPCAPTTSVSAAQGLGASADLLCDDDGTTAPPGGGPSSDCITVTYEISFDGGVTWYPYDVVVCGGYDT